MRNNEVVCMCVAYDHPHRLGGGKCTGVGWCAAFRLIDSFECESCNLSDGTHCEVIEGIERIENAPCYQDEIRTHYLYEEYGHLPLDVENYWTKKQQEYYDHG